MKSKPLILVVDDVPENAALLGATLARSYRIQLVSSGQECLDQVARQRPDLILLDVMMPGMSGYEVFSHLTADERWHEIPVIFVTADMDAQSEAGALHAGAADYIHKPINPHVVRARVKMQLELAQYRHDLERKVLERTQELATARLEAESAQAVVTRFMKNLSHEMRTPMHGIKAFSQMLQQQLAEVGESRLANHADMLFKSANRMNQLVESMLQIAEQNYAEMTHISADTLRRVNLARLIGECILTHGKYAQQHGHSVHLDCAQPNPELTCDPVRLRQVFDALIGNALRYSPDDTSVRIRITPSGNRQNRIVVQVIDQGCGIPDKETAAIFEPFYESTRTHSGAGGTGLGLPLCKSIIKRHRGTISVSNRPEGGAIFEVQLPMEQ